MNKLNLFFIIIGLFIAGSCKLGGERDGPTTPPPPSASSGGGGTTGGSCDTTWKNYCDYYSTNNLTIPQDCYTRGCLTQGGGGSANCDGSWQTFCTYLENNNMTITQECYDKGCIAQDEDSPGYEHPDRPNDPPANCFAAGITPPGAGYLADYRRINIIGHGNYGGKSWSSYLDPRYSDSYENPQSSIFVTDSKLDLRVVAKVPPKQGLNDSLGNKCNFIDLPYTKIRFTLGVRDDFHSFNFSEIEVDLDVGKCTRTYDISSAIPGSHSSQNPLIFEITRVETNYPCTMYPEGTDGYNGFNCGSNPWRELYSNDCFELELQLSTDTTKDLPH